MGSTFASLVSSCLIGYIFTRTGPEHDTELAAKPF
uniref:Uncharacterized protein n=1 Tax=Anguilla anguilla TaxID=7936 RepID=A0A0E9W1A9_ANGAN